MDVAISQSQKYATMLRDNHNLSNVMSLIPGVDLKKFKLRSVKGVSKGNKLIVGYVGRQYTSSDRKNPNLLNKICKLDFIDFRTTGGKLKPDQIPKFYRGLHIVISPATIEGGPMAVQESLACGVPIVCMNGVGVANEFKNGVMRANNNDHFIKILKDMYSTKSYFEHWAKTEVMKEMRKQIESQTWEKFVSEHDQIWNIIPTTKQMNSIKSNSLPILDKQFELFADVQYQGFTFHRSSKLKLLEDYYLLDRKLIEKTVEKKQFFRILQGTIEPLYQIAKNQGFSVLIR